MKLTRRCFLASSTSSLLVTPAPLMIAARPAHAIEPVTTVLAIIAVATAIISMFARADGVRQILAALNAKLDRVIDAQQQTMTALRFLGEQVDSLLRALPNLLQNDDLRVRRARFASILDRQLSANKAIQRGERSDELIDILDNLVEEAWIECQFFYRILDEMTLGTDEDHSNMSHCCQILKVQRDLVVGFRAADGALGKLQERGLKHKQRYGDIARAVKTSVSLYRDRHLPESHLYHKAKIVEYEKAINKNGYTRSWYRRLVALTNTKGDETNRNFSIKDRFATVVSMAPCTHGYNYDDYNDVMGLGFLRSIPWVAYDARIPVTLSGTATFKGEEHQGFAALNLKLGRPSRRAISAGTPESLPRAADVRNVFRPPMPTKEFNCPGVADGDKEYYSQLFINQAKGNIERMLPEFYNKLQRVCMHRWIANAASSAIKELEALVIDADVTQRAIV